MAEKEKKGIKQIGKTISDKTKEKIDSIKENATVAKYTVEAAVDSIIGSIDQTGDGKFDLEDVNELRRQHREKKRLAKLRKDLNALNPVFIKTLSDDDFFVSNMIHVAEMDKQHANNSVCVGSIGHETLVKDLRIVTVYPDQIEKWGLHFYPDINQEFYYVNPINPNLYIGMNDYFEYLRSERVSELQQIAYDLGATYFCVRIKEQKKTKRKNTVDVKLNAKYAKKAEKIENNYSKDENEVSEEEAYAKLSFKGHSPEEPQLYYFKHDPQIKRLIEMRMDSRNELTEQQIILKCSHSSGIKEKDALSIDAAFSALKVTNKTSFTTEAQNEVRQVFEYTIRF